MITINSSGLQTASLGSLCELLNVVTSPYKSTMKITVQSGHYIGNENPPSRMQELKTTELHLAI